MNKDKKSFSEIKSGDKNIQTDFGFTMGYNVFHTVLGMISIVLIALLLNQIFS